jgi:glycosyltransferase involved in cell wall biosynthesis
MKKVLLVQPSLEPLGGGNAVAVWIIEALKRENSVSVLTWAPVSVAAINRFFGTSLVSSDFSVYCAPRLIRGLIELDPDPHSLQRFSLLMRLCKRMKDDYDVVITANGEADLGCRGIQYVHYPWFPRFEPICQQFVDLPWYQRLWGIVRGQYRPWMEISGYSFERMKKNLTLVNSDWTGIKCRESYGIETTTVYPPVPGLFPDVPWEEREDGFVCIGRISGEKRLEKIIDILSEIRLRGGKDIHLHIIGTPGHDMDYYRQVVKKVRENASWVFLNENLSREELVNLVSKHRYGIHAMHGEHFGIAVAEMVKAGCIVFVPSEGGQIEIVGGDERLMYETAEEAVEKILCVMNNSDKQASLRDYLSSRKGLFSAEAFVCRIREIVRRF